MVQFCGWYIGIKIQNLQTFTKCITVNDNIYPPKWISRIANWHSQTAISPQDSGSVEAMPKDYWHKAITHSQCQQQELAILLTLHNSYRKHTRADTFSTGFPHRHCVTIVFEVPEDLCKAQHSAILKTQKDTKTMFSSPR